MDLEQREKKLLEALFDRYAGRDSYPSFAAEWVEEDNGRKYYRVTGTHISSGGGSLDYDTRHSRDEIVMLQQRGLIIVTGIAISEAGKNMIEPRSSP